MFSDDVVHEWHTWLYSINRTKYLNTFTFDNYGNLSYIGTLGLE